MNYNNKIERKLNILHNLTALLGVIMLVLSLVVFIMIFHFAIYDSFLIITTTLAILVGFVCVFLGIIRWL